MISWLIFWAPDFFMCFSLLVFLVYGIVVSSNTKKQKGIFFNTIKISSALQNRPDICGSSNVQYRAQHVATVIDNPIESQLYMNSLFVLWCICAAFLSISNPFKIIHWSGLFVLDTFTSSLSFILFLYAAFCFICIRGWQIQAKIVNEEALWLCCLALIGQRLLLCCTDLMSMYVCLELQSFCFIVICSLNYGSLYSVEAGRKLFLRSAFSSCLLLLGIGFIYFSTGQTNCGHIQELCAYSEIISGDIILCMGIWLVSRSLLWKLAVAPLHMWAADVYEGAQSHVTLLLSTLPKLAVLGFWLHSWHSVCIYTWNNTFSFFSAASLLIGAFGAFTQPRLKRMLAYSSIAHMGFLCMPLCTSIAGSSALLTHLFLYWITSLLIWALIMARFWRHAPAQMHMPQFVWDLSVNWKTMPAYSFLWAIAMMSLAGLPPVAGFLGKLTLFSWSLCHQIYTLIGVAICSTLISSVYYIRIVRVLYLDQPTSWSHLMPLNSITASLVTICMCLLLILLWYSSPLILYTHYISL